MSLLTPRPHSKIFILVKGKIRECNKVLCMSTAVATYTKYFVLALVIHTYVYVYVQMHVYEYMHIHIYLLLFL